MERKSYLIVVLLISVISSVMAEKEYKNAIYNAYVSNKMDTWKNSIDQM